MSGIGEADAKRLSVGENLIGPANVLMMDELDTGACVRCRLNGGIFG